MKKPMLGVMIDCSRDAVPSVGFLKKYASLLASFGYNALMLYTEDTYEVEGEPLFGSMRGRYSIRELQQLDAFLKEKGIELIPCVQTLAHLGHLFKYPEYAPVRDTDDVLLCGEEKTYRLIESVFSSLRKAFSTDRVHIGMDEAYRVGLGKYLEKHGYEERFSVINRHLHRVCALAEKYGFRPMIWSDMFCKLASGMAGDGDFYGADPEEVKKTLEKASLPENVTLVYWDYYSLDKERYSRNIKVNRVFGRPVVFAGGAWTWRGYAPDNTFSFEATKAALSACRENGVEDVFFTSWGDGGSECPKEAVLPALAFGASAAGGEADPEKIKSAFPKTAGIAFDDLVLLDALDCPPETPLEKRHSLPPTRTLLFNDPFLGESDDRVESGSNARYAALEKKYAARKSGAYGEIFGYAASLCAVLKYKAELGVNTRAAYRAKDLEKLFSLAETDYAGAIAALPVFLESFRAVWNRQNKPFGFEVHEKRLGGLLCRLQSCRARLLAFLNGKEGSIPELEEDSVREIRKRGEK